MRADSLDAAADLTMHNIMEGIDGQLLSSITAV
jgi:hypothetical protein